MGTGTPSETVEKFMPGPLRAAANPRPGFILLNRGGGNIVRHGDDHVVTSGLAGLAGQQVLT